MDANGTSLYFGNVSEAAGPVNDNGNGGIDDNVVAWAKYFIEGVGILTIGLVGLVINVFALCILFRKQVSTQCGRIEVKKKRAFTTCKGLASQSFVFRDDAVKLIAMLRKCIASASDVKGLMRVHAKWPHAA